MSTFLQEEQRHQRRDRQQNHTSVGHVAEEALHADVVGFGDRLDHEFGPLPGVMSRGLVTQVECRFRRQLLGTLTAKRPEQCRVDEEFQ